MSRILNTAPKNSLKFEPHETSFKSLIAMTFIIGLNQTSSLSIPLKAGYLLIHSSTAASAVKFDASDNARPAPIVIPSFKLTLQSFVLTSPDDLSLFCTTLVIIASKNTYFVEISFNPL